MKKRIVCLGDSITWGFPWGPSVSWVAMLQKQMDAEFINKGINGNTTSDMLRRFERAVIDQQPTHVIIMGGINDVICAESFDRISWNIREMVEKAEEAGINVILGQPTAVDEPFWELPLVRLREWITRYARNKAITVIPFHLAFYNDKGELRSELLLSDGGHPTEEGYREMFKQIDFSIFD